MEFNVLKVGDEVKFNGKTFVHDKHYELSSNKDDYWWVDEMTDYVKVNLTETFMVSRVHNNGCVELKFNGNVITYSWTPVCLELVNASVEQTPNPYGFSTHKLELLKALIEGKIIQYKSAITSDKWIDLTFVLEALDNTEDNELRVKPPEPVVTTLIKGVMQDGYVTETGGTMEELDKYYDGTDKFILFIKQTFHDGVVVNVEVVKD
jgi:hypothetical protein